MQFGRSAKVEIHLARYICQRLSTPILSRAVSSGMERIRYRGDKPISQLTVKELKELLRGFGVDTSGNKAAMLARASEDIAKSCKTGGCFAHKPALLAASEEIAAVNTEDIGVSQSVTK